MCLIMKRKRQNEERAKESEGDGEREKRKEEGGNKVEGEILSGKERCSNY